MDRVEKIIRLARYFVRFQYLPHLALVGVLCAGAGLVVSLRNLNFWQSAKVIEMYASFSGILLLTPVFMGEQDRELWMLEQSKRRAMWQLYLIRLVIGLLVICAVIAGFAVAMKVVGSQADFWRLWPGGVCETAFLGALGFFAAGVTNHAVPGYLVSVVYYAANMGKPEMFGRLALFQMCRGGGGFEIWMVAFAAVLFAGGIVIREAQSRA